ncbi:protein ENHANCED PSEUDOMONAS SUSCEPTIBILTY 1-like [Durio zibethinus]|uniref:Protein ENHANCED PSEUDOMONAS SUSCEPTIBILTY 1-like n=1 Tax=Durio zibethinus TaxID=66656 RepID=A0A6P5Y575_DURZI|nr:protein ENHANCED PSEUDOMONAS SUSCEPTIBILTY 1-like [Durio zibethinus]
MGDIRFISTSIVQAANPKTEFERIELASWDLMFLAMDYAPKGLLYYRPQLQQDQKLGETLLNEVKNYEATYNPLLAVQVTELSEGSSLAALTIMLWLMAHHLCILSIPGQKFSKGPVGIPNSCLTQIHEFIPPPLQVRLFHFTRENIAHLNAKANAEHGTDKISSLQALLSHIWQAVVRIRNLDPEEETNFFLAVGAKSRLHQLPEQYTRNMMRGGLITMKIMELQEHGLGNEIPVLVTGSLARSINNLLVLGGSTWFDYYSIDFGWGRPIAILSGGGNRHDGKALANEQFMNSVTI